MSEHKFKSWVVWLPVYWSLACEDWFPSGFRHCQLWIECRQQLELAFKQSCRLWGYPNHSHHWMGCRIPWYFVAPKEPQVFKWWSQKGSFRRKWRKFSRVVFDNPFCSSTLPLELEECDTLSSAAMILKLPRRIVVSRLKDGRWMGNLSLSLLLKSDLV